MNDIEIMGVLNITENSFYDGGTFNDLKKSVQHAKYMISEGADIIDIGAESSKPGSDPVPSKEQINKIEPVVESIREVSDIVISIDTRSSEVIKHLTKYKINIVNDISSLEDPELLNIISENNLSVSLMHMQGTPKNMQDNPMYKNVVQDILKYLKGKVDVCVSNGISKDRIIIDPGFGFGKSIEHNFEILNNLKEFKKYKKPLLIGLSRKSMIYKFLNISPDDALNGTSILNMIGLQNGANILRVHDIKEAKECISLFSKLN